MSRGRRKDKRELMDFVRLPRRASFLHRPGNFHVCNKNALAVAGAGRKKRTPRRKPKKRAEYVQHSLQLCSVRIIVTHFVRFDSYEMAPCNERNSLFAWSLRRVSWRLLLPDIFQLILKDIFLNSFFHD